MSGSQRMAALTGDKTASPTLLAKLGIALAPPDVGSGSGSSKRTSASPDPDVHPSLS